MEFVGARFIGVEGRALTREQRLPELNRIITALCTHNVHKYGHTGRTDVNTYHKHIIGCTSSPRSSSCLHIIISSSGQMSVSRR